jgi:hypothetical protein
MVAEYVNQVSPQGKIFLSYSQREQLEGAMVLYFYTDRPIGIGVHFVFS